MDLGVGERVVVVSGPHKDQTGVIKKRGLNPTIKFDEGGKEKSLPFTQIRKWTPPPAHSQEEDQEDDLAAEGVNPLELVIKELQSQVHQVQLGADHMEEELKQEKAAKAEVDKALEEEAARTQALAEALAQVQEDLRSHQSTVETLKEEVDRLNKTVAEDRVEIDALTDALARAQEECRELRKTRHELEGEMGRLSAEKKEEEAAGDGGALEKELVVVQGALRLSMAAEAALKEEVASLTAKLASKVQEVEEQSVALSTLQSQLSSSSEQVESLQSKVESLKAERHDVMALEEELEVARQAAEEKAQEVEEARSEKEVLIQEIQTAQQDLQALRGRWTEVKGKLQEKEKGVNEDVEMLRAELRLANQKFEDLEGTLRMVEQERTAAAEEEEDDGDAAAAAAGLDREEAMTALQAEVVEARERQGALERQLGDREVELVEEKRRNSELVEQLESINEEVSVLNNKVKQQGQPSLSSQVLDGVLSVVSGLLLLDEEAEKQPVDLLLSDITERLENATGCTADTFEGKEGKLQESKQLATGLGAAREECRTLKEQLGENDREKTRMQRKMSELEAMNHAMQSLASQMSEAGRSDREMTMLDEIEKLKHENATLRRRVEDLVEQIALQPPPSCLPFSGSRRPKPPRPMTDKHEMTPVTVGR